MHIHTQTCTYTCETFILYFSTGVVGTVKAALTDICDETNQVIMQ